MSPPCVNSKYRLAGEVSDQIAKLLAWRNAVVVDGHTGHDGTNVRKWQIVFGDGGEW